MDQNLPTLDMLTALKVLTGADWWEKEGMSIDKDRYRVGPEVRNVTQEMLEILHSADVHIVRPQGKKSYRLREATEETILQLAQEKVAREGGISNVMARWAEWQKANEADSVISGRKKHSGKHKKEKTDRGPTLFD